MESIFHLKYGNQVKLDINKQAFIYVFKNRFRCNDLIYFIYLSIKVIFFSLKKHIKLHNY